MEYTSSSDKITRDYFDSLLLETRYLDSDLPSTEVELFGHKFATPIMTAALSHLGSRGRQSASFIEHQALNGMIVYAEAAAHANTLHWVGMGDDEVMVIDLAPADLEHRAGEGVDAGVELVFVLKHLAHD